MTEEQIKIANKTARANGTVGINALVPKYVQTIIKPKDKVLDFGAGPKAIHTMLLRSLGYDVTAYDFGDNVTEVHDVNALNKKYNIVFASNVLNVLTTIPAIKETIETMANVVNDDGILVANVPASPRKLVEGNKATHEVIYEILKEKFNEVNIYGKKSAPIFCCEGKL